MTSPDFTISLADLSAARIWPHPTQAVAIARALTLRAAKGELPGVPSASVIRLSSDGTIGIEGPVAAGRSVERAARLLEAMLPGVDAPSDFRVPGALRLVIGRASGMLDLPPYGAIEEFADALVRFSAPDCAAAVQALCASWSAGVRTGEAAAHETPVVERPAVTDSELTISDVRRARRSTGLTLTDVSRRSRIPVSLLRELEWGYFVNWPAGHYGRTQLVRYARAAGIDEKVVIDAVWPVLQDAIRARAAGTQLHVVDGTIVDEIEHGGGEIVRIEPALPVAKPRPDHRRRRVLAALAIPALIAIGLLPAAWNSESSAGPPAVAESSTRSPREPGAEARRRAVEATARKDSAPASARQAVKAPAPALQAEAAYSPAFATTGSAMFYHSGATGERSAIMRADTDGAGDTLRVTRIVDDTARNFHARPSPDGQSIAFDSDRDGERAVYVADADGRNVRRVTGEGFAAVPSWSPDGRQLAVVRAESDRPRVWNIWTVDLSTGRTRRLTSHRVGQPWGAAWFPDGERIAYSHEDRLIVRSLDGSSQRIYPSPVKGRLIRTPAVSPDGRHVIFQLYKDGVWLLDLADGSTRRILTDPTAEEFTWAPDGRRVAYHSRKTGEWGVWIMAAR